MNYKLLQLSFQMSFITLTSTKQVKLKI